MIARTRKRPRIRSMSFKTLWWLLRREAAFRIVWGKVADEGPSPLRVRWQQLDARYVQRNVARSLRLDARTRFYL